METAVFVHWCDDKKMLATARALGWTEDSDDNILDLVDEDVADAEREFPSITKAKAWARRNTALDFWRQPSIRVYSWPDRCRRSWQRETVRQLRYFGEGLGWDENE